MSQSSHPQDSGSVAKLHPEWLTGLSTGDEASPESFEEAEFRSTYFAGTSRRVRSWAEIFRVALAIAAVLAVAWFVTDDISGRSQGASSSQVSTE